MLSRYGESRPSALPVCGQEISDPGFSTHRARRTALKCANCQTKLEWVKPFWDQTWMHWALIGWIPALIREFAPAPGHDPFLRRLYGLPVDAGLILAILSLLVILFERIGILRPRLKVSNRPYEDPTPYTTWLKDQRAQAKAAQKLQINRRHVLPSFLRGQSVLPLDDTQNSRDSRR